MHYITIRYYIILHAEIQQLSTEKHHNFSICRLFVTNLALHSLFFRNPFFFIYYDANFEIFKFTNFFRDWLFFEFFLFATVFTIVPITDIFALRITMTVLVYILILAEIIVKAPFFHYCHSSSFNTNSSISKAADFFASFFDDDSASK